MVNNTYDYYNLTVIKCNACKNEVLNKLHIQLFHFQYQMKIVYHYFIVSIT